MYVYYNPNPERRVTNDCVIRAVSKIMGISWTRAFDQIADEARMRSDTMDANHVWISWFIRHGFRFYPLPNECPYCYTVKEFCEEHPDGEYILGTGTHVVAVKNGDWFDSFDSADMIPSFCMRRVSKHGV